MCEQLLKIDKLHLLFVQECLLLCRSLEVDWWRVARPFRIWRHISAQRFVKSRKWKLKTKLQLHKPVDDRFAHPQHTQTHARKVLVYLNDFVLQTGNWHFAARRVLIPIRSCETRHAFAIILWNKKEWNHYYLIQTRSVVWALHLVMLSKLALSYVSAVNHQWFAVFSASDSGELTTSRNRFRSDSFSSTNCWLSLIALS